MSPKFRHSVAKTFFAAVAFAAVVTSAQAQLKRPVPITLSLATDKLAVGTTRLPVASLFKSAAHNGQGILGGMIKDESGSTALQIAPASALTLYGTATSDKRDIHSSMATSFLASSTADYGRINIFEERKTESVSFVTASAPSQSALTAQSVTGPVTNAVPEPSTWTTLISGAVLLAVALRRQVRAS